MNELTRAIEQAARDKGIDKTIFIQALQEAIVAAARKRYPEKEYLEVHFNDELGELELFEFKDVVEEVENAENQLTPEQARELDPDAQVGDSLGMKMEVGDLLNRIAAQNAKQVIIQKVREAEKGIIYEEYKDRKGDLINGIVRRVERGNVIVDLGRTEAIMPRGEQIPRESYRPDDRIRGYVLDIQQNARGPAIVLSRSHPNFIRKLFELEVPEIHEGVVEIKAIAREPGNRAKVAVFSYDKDVDPVGACVGMKGSRVQNVVQELKGEKIDIIQYSEDPARLIENALSPADISQVIIDEVDRKMEVIVPDDQLSLAIGRKGQNVKLAVQLTGWNVDIRSESEMLEASRQAKNALGLIPEMTETAIELLFQAGITSPLDLAEADAEELAHESEIDIERIRTLQVGAAKVVEELRAQEERVREWEEKALTDLPGAEEETVNHIKAVGITTIRGLAEAEPGALTEVKAEPEEIEKLRLEARKVLELPEEQLPEDDGAASDEATAEPTGELAAGQQEQAEKEAEADEASSGS